MRVREPRPGTRRLAPQPWAGTPDALLPPLSGDSLEVVAAVLGTEHVTVIDTEFTPHHVAEIALSRLRRRGFCLRREDNHTGGWHPGRCLRFELPHTWVVDPGEELGSHVTRSCGLTDAHVRGAGTFESHLPRLARLLQTTEYLIGWNIGNDKNRLQAELVRTRVSHGRLLWIDLAQMFHRLHPTVGANPARICRLSEACAFYGIVLAEDFAHYALFDVLATCQVLARVCEEWLAAGWARSDLGIALTGYHGPGWDPAVLEAPVGPVTWRLPPSRLPLNDRLHKADRTLRSELVSRDDYRHKQDFYRQCRRADPHMTTRQQFEAFLRTPQAEQLQRRYRAARNPPSRLIT